MAGMCRFRFGRGTESTANKNENVMLSAQRFLLGNTEKKNQEQKVHDTENPFY